MNWQGILFLTRDGNLSERGEGAVCAYGTWVFVAPISPFCYLVPVRLL